jgi:hypothetical protein
MCGGGRESGTWKEEKSAAITGLNQKEMESELFLSFIIVKYIK